MSETNKLNSEFIIELLKATLVSEKILVICDKHLKYQYLETEVQKKVYKYILEYYIINKKAPSIGIIGQQFGGNKDVLGLLTQMKKADVTDIKDELIVTLEGFIKDTRSLILYETFGEMYNEGKKEEGLAYMMNESTAINNFRLKDGTFATVFGGFHKRQESRLNKDRSEEKASDRLVYGIRKLDEYTGGIRRGTLTGWIARSGGGKSTVMRWNGLSNARLGKRIVHFSQEGSEEEVMDAYDAGWTSIDLTNISFGLIPEAKLAGINKAWKKITEEKGEIFVFAVESFDSLSLVDCRQILHDVVDDSGPIDMIIFDYLELFQVGIGSKANTIEMVRKQREDVANGMVNLAVQFNAVSITAVQSNDITIEKYDNPEFVIQRSHISEFKGAIKPMATFISINQTSDEVEEGIARLWVDKFRHHKLMNSPVYIAQSLDIGRFYDNAKTNKLYFSEE